MERKITEEQGKDVQKNVEDIKTSLEDIKLEEMDKSRNTSFVADSPSTNDSSCIENLCANICCLSACFSM